MYNSPVLKHGPRSLIYMQEYKIFKVKLLFVKKLNNNNINLNIKTFK